MLSSPPPRFAAWISAFARFGQVAMVAHDDLLDRVAVDERRETVAADQEDVARLRLDGECVDVDVGIGAERACDHRALRMQFRLRRRELAAADELGDERVVVGQLLEAPAAHHVGARIADVPEGDATVAARRARPSSWFPCRRRRRRCSARSCTRRFASWISWTTRRSPPPAEAGLLHRAGRQARCELARLRAAHAVGDAEERRSDDERVLVAAPLAPVSVCRRSAPILTARTSCPSRRCGRRRRGSACGRGSAGCR